MNQHWTRRRAIARSVLAPALLGIGMSPSASQARAMGDPDHATTTPLRFPRDHGAHLASRVEWWYVTGWLGEAQPQYGFQVTFFRLATGLATHSKSRFSPRHLLMAHAALTDVQTKHHRHSERLARWSGDDNASMRDRASLQDAGVQLGDWRLARTHDDQWHSVISHHDWALDMRMKGSQPLLLQGEAGRSQKGPTAQHASWYYSLPQLQVEATLKLSASSSTKSWRGRAWLDHE